DIWLNEGLSHYAEERGGRAYLTQGDSTGFCNHVTGDMYNLALYFAEPGTSPLVGTSGVGTLAERGADWSFVRYLVDRYASDTTLAAADAFTRALVMTHL